MTSIADPNDRQDVSSVALLPFILITFFVSWGTLGFYIFRPEQAVASFGEINGHHPAFFLATWAPALAAFAVVLACSGPTGVKAYLSRLSLWRCPAGWAAFLLIGVPLIFIAGALMKPGPLWASLSDQGAGAVLGAAILMLFLGPIEEFGWRGVAQPLLQRHVPPLWAGLIIGVTWGVWHLPAFYLSGTVQSGWSFTPFFIGNIALAVIVTPLFNAARGSILLPMLFHWQLINPAWPDAQPYDTYVFAGVAALIVWLNRATMLTRAGACTNVVPGRAPPGPPA
ncbi:MAG: CPBP family intramembrane glutamic endopeptidase [Paracoccaceae bacterium]